MWATKVTWKSQVEEHIDQTVLKNEDATDRRKRCNGTYELFRNMR